jgi:prevent-host-death family protein
MKTATAKDLRVKTAALLDEVRWGHEVLITHRGKPVAILAPLPKREHRKLDPIGFGIWRSRKDMRSVGRWLSKARAARYRRSSSTRTS